MGLKVGSRLRAQNSSCEVIVVKGSDSDAVLLCAGVEMALTAAPEGTSQVTEGPSVELGKRYSDDESGIEILCTKSGLGPLSFEGRELGQKSAKPLPASD
ncbi:hypothetical protein ACSMXN_14810 [Jatrophihabitans sp. DSM 45814]